MKEAFGIGDLNPAKIGKTVGNFAEDKILDPLVGVFGGIFDTIKGLLDKIVDEVRKFVESIPRQIKENVLMPIYNKTIKPVWDKMKSVFGWLKTLCLMCCIMCFLSSIMALGIPQMIISIIRSSATTSSSSAQVLNSTYDTSVGTTPPVTTTTSAVADSMVMFNGLPTTSPGGNSNNNNNIMFNMPNFASNRS